MKNIIRITDFKDPKLYIYARTPEVQLLRYWEPKPGIFIAESSTVEEVCKNARRIAVLENVVNPTNVGAIVRSAAALGMDFGNYRKMQVK